MLHPALLLAVNNEWHHAEEADQQGGQVHPPVLFLGQPALLHQRQRQGDEAGHQDRMQGQDAEIQAQQIRMPQGR
ncbi:hypothetical protein D9M68_913490 [compost metagenome]